VVEKLLRVEDVARDVLHLGRTKVYELLARGELRSVAVGRNRRIP
jgi:excisionase family DNA binding protein